MIASDIYAWVVFSGMLSVGMQAKSTLTLVMYPVLPAVRFDFTNKICGFKQHKRYLCQTLLQGLCYFVFSL